MKPKTLLILVIAFLVVIGAYLGFEKLYVPRTEEKKAKEEKVFPLTEEDITGIELASPAEVIVLEKDDGTWDLTEPVRTPADNGEVASLIAFALDAEIQRNFGDPEETDVDLTEFGLDEPVLTVTLTAGDDASRLVVGGETLEGERLYALVERGDDEKTLVLIDSLVLSDLDRNTRTLRKKDITAFHTDEVQRFSVTRNEKTVTAERTGVDDWIVTEPVEFAADPTEVLYVLDYVTEAEAVSFMDDGAEDRACYGQKDPQITLVLTDADGATSTLLIGDEDENGDYYALREGTPWVFTVSASVKNKLTLSEESLMARFLLDYTVSDVTGFTLETKDETFSVSRTDGGWEIDEPEGLPGDKAFIDNLLFDFKSLWFDEVVEKPTMDPGRNGLDDPLMTLHVVYEEELDDGPEDEAAEKKKKKGEEEPRTEEKEATLIFGDREDGGVSVRVIREDADFVAFVSLEDMTLPSPTLFDLKGKSLVMFEPDEVERVRIEWEGDTYELEKKKKKWVMTAPEEGDMDVEMMTYLLLDISDLAYYDVLYDTTENLEPFGLDDPVISISLFGPEGAELGEIILGPEDEEYGHRSAVSSELPMIYAVESDLVDDVYLDILDLQE